MPPVRNVLVLGGSGFVGKEICRRASDLGLNVTGLSRRGKPSADKLHSKDVAQWLGKVRWCSEDAANIKALAPIIDKSDAIVHAIGIMIESDVNHYFSGSGSSGSNCTYEKSNRDSALVTLDYIKKTFKNEVKPFVFVSASTGVPFIPRYLAAKMEVEARIRELHQAKMVRGVVLRPGVIYHNSKASSRPIAKLFALGRQIDAALSKLVGRAVLSVPEPTPLELVADAAVQAALSPSVSGTLGNTEMWDMTTGAQGKQDYGF